MGGGNGGPVTGKGEKSNILTPPTKEYGKKGKKFVWSKKSGNKMREQNAPKSKILHQFSGNPPPTQRQENGGQTKPIKIVWFEKIGELTIGQMNGDWGKPRGGGKTLREQKPMSSSPK